jgi:shikimate dehydrogenase
MTIESRSRTEINGATRLIAIIGDPIEQVKSPIFYNRMLADAGANAVLVPWHALPDTFDVVMKGLLETRNLDGVIVTYPYKQRALAFATSLEPMAERLGSVNALRREADGRWTGGMFDGLGLVEAAKSREIAGKGARVQLIGAGGAGSAIAYALASEGAASIAIAENDITKRDALVDDLKARYRDCVITPGCVGLKDVSVLINATPVGLNDGDGLPVPIDGMTEHTAVIDIVPGRDTELLRRAAALGCRTLGGSAMVEGQTGIVLRFLRKIEANEAPAGGNAAAERA